MIRFQYEVTIEASPDEVFAVMSDIGRFDERLSMDGRAMQPGPTGVGTRFASTGTMGPLRLEGGGEITHFEPGRRFRIPVAEAECPRFRDRHRPRVDGACCDAAADVTGVGEGTCACCAPA